MKRTVSNFGIGESGDEATTDDDYESQDTHDEDAGAEDQEEAGYIDDEEDIPGNQQALYDLPSRKRKREALDFPTVTKNLHYLAAVTDGSIQKVLAQDLRQLFVFTNTTRGFEQFTVESRVAASPIDVVAFFEKYLWPFVTLETRTRIQAFFQ